jgi:iron(III) transport system permease protein
MSLIEASDAERLYALMGPGVERSGGALITDPENAEGIANALRELKARRPDADELGRRGRAFQEGKAQFKPLARHQLHGFHAAIASLACLLPVVLGFVVPGWVLLRYSLLHYEVSLNETFYRAAWHSLSLSLIAAAVAVAIGLFMAYSLRLQRAPAMRALAWIASLGYGMPGAILAVGAIIPVAWLDNTIDAYMRATFGISTGLLLSGTIVAVIIGYVVRFLVLSFGTIDAGLAKVTRSMDDAARSLGHGPLATLRRVHLPMLRGSILTAGLLVFVDCMKELPMTLLRDNSEFPVAIERAYAELL